jgi:dihydroneopterin aldolase
VKIKDSALVAAAELSYRYIADRFLPDKAIDLMDEATSRIAMELQSVPSEIDEVQRRLVQLELAARQLAEESEEHAKERLKEIEAESSDLRKKLADLRQQWEAEKMGVGSTQELRKQLDEVQLAFDQAGVQIKERQASGQPVILTVGLPGLARPKTGHRPTQRRIDLLAIEQNAWVLAARDPRCVVVSTRTEIDWAMKNGRMIVWAPSKLVLDAVDGPKGSDPVALALWLAEHLAAQALVLHGSVTVPAGSRVPVERG